MKPATELPWHIDHYDGLEERILNQEEWYVASVDLEYGERDDAAYIAHACNAYPKLVEALRLCVGQLAYIQSDNSDPDDMPWPEIDTATQLLAELGEE